jgi:hypothetical protein
VDNVNPYTISGAVSCSSMFFAMLHGDAAGVAANLPSYTALNAWDMLSETESGLEGL